ncbi:hypothetical protein VKT23_019819 [Stygiomarasmius scandens]|uniref:Uncharacterized protein n=1 Tax=Marasmiellus scandens TaxID=2682957 RepID=A0ABR1INB1_9AGAR
MTVEQEPWNYDIDIPGSNDDDDNNNDESNEDDDGSSSRSEDCSSHLWEHSLVLLPKPGELLFSVDERLETMEKKMAGMNAIIEELKDMHIKQQEA